jgi:hypothetical protein
MKNVALILTGIFMLAGMPGHADEATEQAVIDTLMASNAYTKKYLKRMDDVVSMDGSLEFWSNGGLLNKIGPDTPPQEYESFDLSLTNITIITLVPGQIAVAQYYSEGSLHPKSSTAVNDYRTRVTQVFVKEDGKWKARAGHWSPIDGKSGTSQTKVDD